MRFGTPLGNILSRHFGDDNASLILLVAALLIYIFFEFVYYKRHRNWKLYKKIKGENAEKASEWLDGPEKPSASVFPDVSSEDEPKE